jgi:two-component system, chemotaxis family, CheB/CheR fusion protein
MAKPRRAAPRPQRVVGIGASAGGLDALKQLVGSVPEDTGLAFVVLQHLPLSQIGQLANLLASATAIPVIDAANGHRIEPNTILVVPPHTSACLFRGALVLRTAKPGARPRQPIDALFASIADVLRERAVGVVLSGTAQDGTEGLRAIRAAGGLSFAQDPSTAQFDEMPRSAIAAGVTELVLSPAQIGEELGKIAKLGPRPGVAVGRSAAATGIARILEQLREASGIDFSSYKRSTIERRLARRVAKCQLASLDEYSSYLTAHPEEASAVYEDLLIHVTEFFRDRPVLDRLVDDVLPELLRNKSPAAAVRIWVPGCSTGEEVYSLAMLLIELCGEHGRPLQLFGSDLSERAIEAARQGHYPDKIAKQVGAERLARFFHPEGGGYQINRDVRERCVFVRHDLVTDPPFSKLDLVSCRNVLIYLGAALQQRVIPIFHYALNQPGYLLLGPAETISGFEAQFHSIDADARIYARKPGPRTSLTFPIASQLGRLPTRRPADAVRSALDVQREVDHVLLARYAPACVLIDDNLDVVQFRGRTGSYLEAPPGQPQLNVLKMAREGLASELPLIIQRARQHDAPVRQDNLVVRDHGQERRFHLEVVPLRRASSAKRHFLVVFEAVASKPIPAARHAPGKLRQRDRRELERVRQELDATKEYLNSAVAQHLATSEELGITNVELQSTNEELQSTNEELQTAKEELQSTNEELETVNEELQRGNRDLRDANDDLVNVLASVDIAIIIVDTLRGVRRFTPKARAVMKLIPGDVGRPIADLQPSVELAGLDGKIAEVVETLAVHESEVHHADGTTYRMQIRPYRTTDHKISGAVIAFVDITALRAARDYAAAIVGTVPTPLVVIDERLLVRSANPAFLAMFDIAASELAGRALLEVGEWRLPTLRARLDGVAVTGSGFEDLELEVRCGAVERVLRLGARTLPAAGGRLILVAIEDMTEHRRLDQVRAAARRERESFLDAVSHELRTPLSAILLWAEALRDLEDSDPLRVHAIETIEQSARAESQLVDDLLDLALSRTSELAVKLVPLDPSTVVAAAIDAVRPDAIVKRIAIETTLATGPKIAADPRRLRQITSNLLGNAIKFTPEGGTVSVALAHDRGVMELCVRDTGPGIAPEFLPRVFDAFSQADPSITRIHHGLGIGLALVRHFVVRQGGTIDVASPGAGQGTTFTVRIPAPLPIA